MKTATEHSTHSTTRSPRSAESAVDFFRPIREGGKPLSATTEPFFQAKLTVGAPNDKYEQEADAVADQVVQRMGEEQARPQVQAKLSEPGGGGPIRRSMPSITPIPMTSRPQRSPEPEVEDLQEREPEEGPELQRKPIFESAGEETEVQRKCTACAADEEGMVHRSPLISALPTGVQRKCAACTVEEKIQPKPMSVLQRSGEGGFTASDDFSSKLAGSRDGGSSLPEATRTSMEAAIGADFSGVRVHTGSSAVNLSNSIGARAFTHGSDVYFNSGQYNPGSKAGNRLLAHELVHTVQQGGSRARAAQPQVQRRPGNVVQRAWYSFATDAADWVGDKVSSGASAAWDGAKWAGGKVYDGAVWVKDKAVDAVMWIYDKAKSVINGGKKWVKSKWASLKSFAATGMGFFKKVFNSVLSFAKSPLAMIGNAIMNMNEEVIRSFWNMLTGKVQFIWSLFQAMGNGLINQVANLWSAIGSFVGGIFNKINGILGHWAFRKLPSSLQSVVRNLVSTFRNLWNMIRATGEGLIRKVRQVVNDAFRKVRQFIARVMSFAIDTIILGIARFGKLLLFLRRFLSNPLPYLNNLANRIMPSLLTSDGQFAGQVSRFVGPDKKEASESTDAGPAMVQRTPATDKKKTSSSWSEIGDGILHMMGKKWEAVKKNPGGILLNLLLDMVLPIVGNVKDVIKLFTDIKAVVTKPLSAGSLEEFWNSLLRLLDIPIMIYNTFWGIVGRTLMLPLLIASFIPHPVVKGIAAAVGYGLLGAMIQGELANIGHKILLLRTGKTDEGEKKQVFNRLSDSLIAFAMEVAMAALMLILSVVGNIVKGVFNFIRNKIVSPKVKPAPGVDPATGKVDVDVDAPKSKPDADGKTKADVEDGKIDLESTKNKDGKDLTPEELKMEMASFKDGEIRKLDDPDFDLEVKLPNGHKYKRNKKTGNWCRFSREHCFVFSDPYNTNWEIYQDLKKEGLIDGTFEEFMNVKPGGVPAGTDISADIKNGTVSKPQNGDWGSAPNWDKWVKEKGGSILQHGDGSVTYVTKDGTWVRYNNQGYPDFSNHLTHPEVQSVEISGGFSKSRTPDYKKANKKAGKELEWGDKPPDGYYWHHHEDGKTMQLVPAGIHDKFPHAGGVSTTVN